MATDSKLTEQQLFDQLISSLVHSAWVFMGKIKNPINDKLERNLDQATLQIDMLDMLYKRMTGNLSENEDQYLSHLIRELKMNFVEEKNKKSENGESKIEDEADKMEDGTEEMSERSGSTDSAGEDETGKIDNGKEKKNDGTSEKEVEDKAKENNSNDKDKSREEKK